LDQHTASDVNTARECDGTWYSVKPGDHIVAKCWILVDHTYVYTGTAPAYSGGRLGMDFYAPSGVGKYITIVDGHPHDGSEHIASVVPWGTVGWTLRTWDIIIPNTIYTKDSAGKTIPPSPITCMVLWLDVKPVSAKGSVWFADGELYINPNSTPTAPTPPSTPTAPTPPPQNVSVLSNLADPAKFSGGKVESAGVIRIDITTPPGVLANEFGFPALTLGQTLLFRAQAKTSAGPLGPVSSTGGARIGLNIYNAAGTLLRSFPTDTTTYVGWNTASYKQLPSISTTVQAGEVRCGIWIQAITVGKPAGTSAWFTNLEFYILNPGQTAPPPPSSTATN
jgi:hypothetical protein